LNARPAARVSPDRWKKLSAPELLSYRNRQFQPIVAGTQEKEERRLYSARSTALVTFAVFGLALTAGSAQAALVISNNATKNVSCSAGVCTATHSYAVMNVGDLTSMLASSDVTLVTGSMAEDVDSKVAFSWASAHRLTLDAYDSIIVEKPVTVAGPGALTLRTNDGGAGGNFLTQSPGRIAFWDTSSSLVINGLTYVLVPDIAALSQDVASNRWGRYALADNYDATTDGVYASSPVLMRLQGAFEGLGNRISNLSVVLPQPGKENAGLFSEIYGATVENLTMTNSTVENLGRNHRTGILVAYNLGTIKNVHVGGKIVVRDISKVGGLVGFNIGTIVLSSSAGVVDSGNGSVAGGLVGESEGPILNSHSTAKVSISAKNISTTTGRGAGGLVGLDYGAISDSWASGDVSISGGEAGQVTEAGGLIGASLSGSTAISNSYSTGAVSVSMGGVGGFIGGGFFGSNANSGLIDCYSVGAVSGTPSSTVGGFVGEADTSEPISDVYWDLETSGVSDPSQGAGNIANFPGITGLTDTQLKSGLPAGFDPSIWRQNPSINKGYPYLIANPPQ
jgi:hypothetical protein